MAAMISVKDLGRELGLDDYPSQDTTEAAPVNDENTPSAPAYCKRISLSVSNLRMHMCGGLGLTATYTASL